MPNIKVFFDGSSLGKGKRGGPGPSAGAAILETESGSMLSKSVYLPSSDSDAAEYWGLICGLELAAEAGVKALVIYGDSRNIIDHVLGKKEIRRIDLNRLKETVISLLSEFLEWKLLWIPRRKNILADAEARLRRGGLCSAKVASIKMF